MTDSPPPRSDDASDESVSGPERAVRALDRWQGERRVVAYPVAVIRKYADDRGSAFAALFTHYAFLALFPLLVVLLTVLDRVVHSRPDLQARIIDSVVVELPVIGHRLEQQAQPLSVNGFLMILSAITLLWGATGFYNSAQLLMSQLWNVQGVDRPGFFARLLRAGALVVTLAAGVTLSAAVWWTGLFSPAAGMGRVASIAGAVVLDTGLLAIGLRIVTPRTVPWKRLLLPALATGIAWEILQLAGHWLVVQRLTDLGDLYGVFALVLVTIAWLNLGARVAVVAVEAAVVAADGLWPRRLAQPPLLDADREVLERIVRNEHRRPEEQIDITWQEPDASRP